MAEPITSVAWEALEHMHGPKGADWFWVLGIVTLAVSVAAIVLGNALFGILILIAGGVVGLSATRPAKVIPYEVTTRGVREGSFVYPYNTLETFYIDEQNPVGPQLLIRSKKLFMPLLILPLPPDYVDEVEALIASRLPEEHLEEPLSNKVLEFFGF